jgi:hypothetical protein
MAARPVNLPALAPNIVLSRASERRVDDCRRTGTLFADGGVRYDHAMSHIAALPFTISRSDDVVGVREITSTREQLHGLLRLEGDDLIIQWRTSRTTDRVGAGDPHRSGTGRGPRDRRTARRAGVCAGTLDVAPVAARAVPVPYGSGPARIRGGRRRERTPAEAPGRTGGPRGRRRTCRGEGICG